MNFEYDVTEVITKPWGYHIVDPSWNAIIVGDKTTVMVESRNSIFKCGGTTMKRSIIKVDSASDYTINVVGNCAHLVRIVPRF